MAATTAFRASSVTFDPLNGGPQRSWGKVQLLTRGGKLALRSADGTVNEEVEGVLSVSKVGNRTWRITTAEGAYTAVQDRTGCRSCR